MKKLTIICFILAGTLLLSACSAQKTLEDTCKDALQKVGDTLIDIGEKLKEDQPSESDTSADNKAWEDTCKSILQELENVLTDLYNLFHEDLSEQGVTQADGRTWENFYTLKMAAKPL